MRYADLNLARIDVLSIMRVIEIDLCLEDALQCPPGIPMPTGVRHGCGEHDRLRGRPPS